MGVVIGDVVGHGLHAAAVMAATRNMLHARVLARGSGRNWTGCRTRRH
ncbi:SpoIIE family protein phosphatase [Streptomyces sp. NPDC003393]